MSAIAIVGGNGEQQTTLRDLFAAAGLEATPWPALELERGIPDVLVVTGHDVMDILSEVREHVALAAVPILACVPSFPQSASVQALSAGATEVLMLPAPAAVAGTRLRNLIALGAGNRRAAPTLGTDGQGSLRVLQALQAAGDDPWPAALARLCEEVGFDRASMVAHVAGSEVAYVISTSDRAEQKFALQLRDYPELATALATGEVVWVADAGVDPRLDPVRAQLPLERVRCIAVVPALYRERVVGALVLRRRRVGGRELGAVGMLRWLAAVMATYLEFGPVAHALREENSRLSRVHYEAERRLYGIDSLRRHFEASADGVLILDQSTRVLYINRAAEELTGFGRDGLLGSPLEDLVSPVQRQLIADAVAKVLRNHNVEPFDLELLGRGVQPVTVSVTTSTALADRAAAVLTFRDVTAKRALERELASTKDFLERLINSTVDAIIVANLKGDIVLFNRGAERLLGYSQDEVLGHLNVEAFYPPGVSAQMMRMLRATSHGGVGRLEPTRREVRTKSGEMIPISMTASLIYEGGVEVASVGILTDLRERIRMESKLLAAQAQLQQSEKQAIVAQLAGATAHELNQPLTAIFGYAELLRRQNLVPVAGQKALDAILSEAERMAELVKKIGRLSQLETMEYVGSATIVDLERSSKISALPVPGSEVAWSEARGGEVIDAFDEELHTQEFFASPGLAELAEASPMAVGLASDRSPPRPEQAPAGAREDGPEPDPGARK